MEEEASPSSPDAARAAGTAQAESLAGILLLEAEEEDRRGRNRNARNRTDALLGALARLQHGLLGADGADIATADLRSLLESLPVPDDPVLAAVLRATALRVRIELALRGQDDTPF